MLFFCSGCFECSCFCSSCFSSRFFVVTIFVPARPCSLFASESQAINEHQVNVPLWCGSLQTEF